jgi:2-keto-4-pentenoate hydratase
MTAAMLLLTMNARQERGRHAGGMDRISQLAHEIDAAHRERRLLEAAGRAPLGLDTAYEVQRALTALRTARGARRIGWKLGYTSDAMRQQMGVDTPNYGPLLDTMLIAGRVPEVLIQPRVEPEIALVLGPQTRATEARATLEVVDSVWRDYRFGIELNTADGSSAAAVVLGPPLPLEALDTVPVQLLRNGELVGAATGAAAMGHPLRALDWLATALVTDGRQLRPGDLVLTGGLTAAVPVEQGDVLEAVFGGSATVRLTRPPDHDRTGAEHA